jgi:hypothetical protein
MAMGNGFAAASGVMPTRNSCGLISFGHPIFMLSLPDGRPLRPCGARVREFADALNFWSGRRAFLRRFFEKCPALIEESSP